MRPLRWDAGRPGLSADARLLIAGQRIRAAGYGLTAVLLGVLLAARGFSPVHVGLVLTALIAGTELASLVVGGLVDNGPTTTLEQAMLAAEDAGTAAVFGGYNMVGAAAGALGALAVTLAGLAHGRGNKASGWLFIVLVPVGLAAGGDRRAAVSRC